ncbi:MAG: sodium:solute symporter [Deltaproteobacteria bacterium]|jgi:Na+/H+ antiporter NhaC|nr:sodium:solute symporter [Deltaproteobacteria bacterium]
METLGILSVVPPVLAVVLAMATRNVYVALFLGCYSAYSILAGNPLTGMVDTLNSFVNVFTGSSNTIVIFSLLMIGGIILLINKSGGIEGFVQFAVHKKSLIKSRKGAQIFSWVIGVLIFTSGTLHCLVAGTIARPISDAFKVSHEKLTFIVRTTSTPVCVLLPLSGWGAFMIGLLQAQDVAEPVSVLARSIPLNFYCLIAVLSVPVLILLGRDFSKMKTAEERARSTGLLDRKPREDVKVDTGYGDAGKASSMWNMVAPLGGLILMILVALFVTGRGNLLEGSGMQALLWGCSFAVLVAGILYVAQRLMTVGQFLDNFFKGSGNMIGMAAILMLAFSLGAVVKQLETGKYLADLFKDALSPGMLPLLIFLISCAISFSTGTSMGTMTVMSAIALPLAVGVEGNIPLAFAALVGGSIFGDHSSPISDTAILSCSSCGCDLMDHVTSQLPYTLTIAAVTMVIYLGVGMAFF